MGELSGQSTEQVNQGLATFAENMVHARQGTEQWHRQSECLHEFRADELARILQVTAATRGTSVAFKDLIEYQQRHPEVPFDQWRFIIRELTGDPNLSAPKTIGTCGPSKG
jgi:hypothetical protein